MKRWLAPLLLLALAGLAWTVEPGEEPGEGWAFPEARDPQAARAVRALARAYPGRGLEAAYRDGDWAVRVDDTWYYWAQGRLLPEGLRGEWPRYAPYRFYRYPDSLPPVAQPDPQTRERLRAIVERNTASPPERYEGLLSALYQAGTRGQTEARVTTVSFLGLTVRVHQLVAPALSAVAEELGRLREADPMVRDFLAGLKGLAGYNWRPIDGTRSRSYHSYGIAVDLVPAQLRRAPRLLALVHGARRRTGTPSPTPAAGWSPRRWCGPSRPTASCGAASGVSSTPSTSSTGRSSCCFRRQSPLSPR